VLCPGIVRTIRRGLSLLGTIPTLPDLRQILVGDGEGAANVSVSLGQGGGFVGTPMVEWHVISVRVASSFALRFGLSIHCPRRIVATAFPGLTEGGHGLARSSISRVC
jgi:hypothetical protein